MSKKALPNPWAEDNARDEALEAEAARIDNRRPTQSAAPNPWAEDNARDVLPAGAIELPADLPNANLNLHNGTGHTAEKRRHAVFSDVPGQSFTAEDLANAKEDTKEKSRTAFVGGALDAATLGFGDEASAALQSATSGRSYREIRDENRAATRTAREGDPKAFALGQLTGGAAGAALTPGLAPVAGKSLLSAGNMVRAATAGGLAGLGESEADLTRGEVGQAAVDTAKGAVFGAGVNAGLGAGGAALKGAQNIIGNASARVARRADNALLDAATLGAPASMRDSLQGELGSQRPQMLALIRSNPELEKAILEGRKADAANLLRTMQNEHGEATNALISEMESGKANVRGVAENVPGYRDTKLNATQEMPAVSMSELVGGKEATAATAATKSPLPVDARPIVAAMEKRLAILRGNPSVESQAEAAALQKRIDILKDRYIPAPPAEAPKGNELLGKLVEGGDAGDKQRAGVQAKQFLATAERFKLGDAYAKGPQPLLEKIDDTLGKLNKNADRVYDKASKGDIYVANVTGKLREWSDELRREVGGMRIKDADNIDAAAANIAQAAANANKPTMSPRELRQLITNVQGKAFSGSYLDPTEARAMQREFAGKLREVLDGHVAKHASKADLAKIDQVNKQISALIAFRDAAEKRAAAANLTPALPPETRTGMATIADIRNMANATKDADVRRDITGALYDQVGPQNARALATADERADLMSRLEAPLTHIAERNTTPPTTLRSHAGNIMSQLEHGGVAGGLLATAAGHPAIGLSIIASSLAAKYGRPAVVAADRGLAAMAEAARRGASESAVRAVGRAAKVPAQMIEDTVVTLSPRSQSAVRTYREAGEVSQ